MSDDQRDLIIIIDKVESLYSLLLGADKATITRGKDYLNYMLRAMLEMVDDG